MQDYGETPQVEAPLQQEPDLQEEEPIQGPELPPQEPSHTNLHEVPGLPPHIMAELQRAHTQMPPPEGPPSPPHTPYPETPIGPLPEQSHHRDTEGSTHLGPQTDLGQAAAIMRRVRELREEQEAAQGTQDVSPQQHDVGADHTIDAEEEPPTRNIFKLIARMFKRWFRRRK